MDERRIREAYLIGDNALEKLKNARVAIFGIGGVGSFCRSRDKRLLFPQFVQLVDTCGRGKRG